MDLNKLSPKKADKGAVIEILHPVTGQAIEGMTVTVLGMDSQHYQDVKRRKVQESLDKKVKARNKTPTLDAKEIAEAGLRDLAELTVSWTGFEFGKDPYECTTENAFELYRKPEFKWLVDQIDEFVSDRVNFF